MKQLLVLASFFAIVFFLSGCQKDMPVSPADEIVALEKPIKPNAIIGELLKDPDQDYLDLQVEWPAIRNATLYNVIVGTQYTLAFYPPTNSALITNVAPIEPGTEVIVKIIAYKDKKGQSVVIAEGTQTFIYNPPPTNLTVNSDVTTLESGILNFNADWEDVPGAVKYTGTLTRSLTGTPEVFEVTNSEYLFPNASFKSADCNFTITVQAKNSLGAVIASGSDTYEYTFIPPAVPNIPLTGEITEYFDNYLDLLVLWDAVDGAVIYHCINFMSYNGQLFIDDHDYLGWRMGNINPIIPGVFNIITIEARDIDGNVIAWGTKTFTYTPTTPL